MASAIGDVRIEFDVATALDEDGKFDQHHFVRAAAVYLLLLPEEIEYVVDSDGQRLRPEELWLPRFGTWLRSDGSAAKFVKREPVEFRWNNANFAKRAVFDWKHQRLRRDRERRTG